MTVYFVETKNEDDLPYFGDNAEIVEFEAFNVDARGDEYMTVTSRVVTDQPARVESILDAAGGVIRYWQDEEEEETETVSLSEMQRG